MSKEKKDNSGMIIAIIGLIGTLVAAALGSPLLVELLKDRQATEVPPTGVTQVIPPESQVPSFTEQILIFQEDFDNDNVSGFGYEGNWVVGKDKNNKILNGSGPGKAVFGPSDFTNGVIEFRIQPEQFNQGAYAAINFRNNETDTYAIAFLENRIILGSRKHEEYIKPFNNGATRSLIFEKGVWYLIRIEARDAEIIVFVDNNRILSANDNNLQEGGLFISLDYGVQAAIDDIRVWELK